MSEVQKDNTLLTWDDKLKILEKFIRVHKRNPRANEIYENINLQNWFRKSLYGKDKIRIKKIKGMFQKLEDTRVFKKRTPVNWDTIFNLVKAYIEKTGSLPQSGKNISKLDLRVWISHNQSDLQSNEQRRNKVRALLEKHNIILRQHSLWDEYFPILKEHLDKGVPTKYSTDKKFCRWVIDLTRRWKNTNEKGLNHLSKNYQDELESVNFKHLIVDDMLEYENLKRLHGLVDIELYRESPNSLTNNSVLSYDFNPFIFIKRERLKRDKNILNNKQLKILSLFDECDLSLTSSQRRIKIEICNIVDNYLIFEDIKEVTKTIFKMTINKEYEKNKNPHVFAFSDLIDGIGQSELSVRLNISRERVRQIFEVIMIEFKNDVSQHVDLYSSCLKK